MMEPQGVLDIPNRETEMPMLKWMWKALLKVGGNCGFWMKAHLYLPGSDDSFCESINAKGQFY